MNNELKTEAAEEKELSAENETADTAEKRRKLPIALPIICAALILTAGIAVSAITLGAINSEKHEAFIATEQSNVTLASPSGQFLEGISVNGVDLGGQTMLKSQDMMYLEESKMIPSINYSLKCHDKIVYLTEDNFDFQFDTVKVLNEAYEYSEYMRKLLTDEGRTKLRASEQKDFTITMTFNEESINTACAEVSKKVDVEMQNAAVSSIDPSKEKVWQMFSFTDGVTGYSLDAADLATQISTLISNKTYEAELNGKMEEVEPEISLYDLKKNLVLISQYETWSGNTWAGNMNMTVAMESMNGSIIHSGEVFSFNEKTGNSNLAENGYYSAGVIVNGKSTDGIGGGICQAATTIYNAAIRADMTVVEREPHTWPSVYVPVGIDSAIDYGNIDMKFRNDTGHDVYLICYMDGAQLNAFIYGYKPTEYDEIVVSSWFTGGSGIGFGAAACRNYYKDGKLVKEDELPSSFYSNGGGTSYAFDEPLSGYVFRRVFTDAQIEGKPDRDIDTETETDINEEEKSETELEISDEDATNDIAY